MEPVDTNPSQLTRSRSKSRSPSSLRRSRSRSPSYEGRSRSRSRSNERKKYDRDYDRSDRPDGRQDGRPKKRTRNDDNSKQKRAGDPKLNALKDMNEAVKLQNKLLQVLLKKMEVSDHDIPHLNQDHVRGRSGDLELDSLRDMRTELNLQSRLMQVFLAKMGVSEQDIPQSRKTNPFVNSKYRGNGSRDNGSTYRRGNDNGRRYIKNTKEHFDREPGELFVIN